MAVTHLAMKARLSVPHMGLKDYWVGSAFRLVKPEMTGDLWTEPYPIEVNS